jgi:hypothetical protein
MAKLKIGDLVAIRGDLRRNYKRECVYAPSQLVENKFLKNPTTQALWIGRVEKIDEQRQEARVAGGWRGFEFYEVMLPNQESKQ